MEQPNIIEAKRAVKPENAMESGHAEAVALVEKHRDFFEHYAKGKIKIEPAPEGMETFAFNLETNTIYVNSMFYKKLGLSEEKTVFATLHEIEHFMEKIQLLAEQQKRGRGGRTIEESGEKKFEKYLKRIEGSRAFSLMDNCVADIRENRAIVSGESAGRGELERKIYTEDLFPENDFTSDPRHIQFCNALLREARLPGEKCQVSPEVRQALDEVANTKGLMDIMTNPKTPMSMRLKLQDKYIWPKVEALLEKDKEDKKKPKKEGDGGKDSKDGKGQKGEPKQKGGSGQGEKSDQKSEKTSGAPQKGSESGQGEGSTEPKQETDPNKIFADDYKKAEAKFPEAVPLKEVEKAFKQWKEGQKNKDNTDKADEEYAEKIGLKKEDVKFLREYRRLAESLCNIINPETDISLIDELRNIFAKIISKRLKQQQSPRYPVEEGDELVDPAQLVADVKSGNLQPKVWEDTEIQEKKGDKFGEVEITLVCDRSSSMADGNGQKAIEQRNCAVLVMEVLKEFADMCEEERMNIDKPLEVRSEIYTFASSSEDTTPLKNMSKDLGEAERINVLKKLNDLPGSTTDFNCLKAIDGNLDDKTKQKIKEGELKKIVIIFTDGGSDNPTEVQASLNSLRENGVIAIGIGMTEAGKPVLSTYAPNAMVVEDVTKLPVVIGNLLKEHLKDL